MSSSRKCARAVRSIEGPKSKGLNSLVVVVVVTMLCASATAYNATMLAVRESMERALRAHDFVTGLQNNVMNNRERAAWEDCAELFEDTIYRLNVCLRDATASIHQDTPFFLSAALTNMDTCLNGFHDLNVTDASTMKALISSSALNVSKMVSYSLSMYRMSSNDVKNRRRLLWTQDKYDGLPEWLSVGDRRLLQSSSQPKADVMVAQDGSGNYRTIGEAVETASEKSTRRYIIHIKAGTYKENILISRTMTNLMFIGDGKDETVVTGSKNQKDTITTFKTATFAVSGDGFIARDITFENTAGPEKNQAVALLVGADKSVVYRCSIKGYQDTLYVYSLRQFYSQVDIYGTVDFIFGNAAVVIQNSNILARKPMGNQKNTITAQARTDPNQNTGISIHNCKVSAAPDLAAVKGSIETYLGRPWREYSRTVFMQSTLDDLIHPAGWLEWDGSFALNTLYYGEYMNRGGGAGTSGRVKWRGFHVLSSATEASQFTVGNFISGDEWIVSAGASFTSGLI